MTKQECAVLTAHTGIALLQGEDLKFFYEYLEHLFGRKVYTHEIPKLTDEIKERSREDFEFILGAAIDIDSILDDVTEYIYETECDDDDCIGEECGYWKYNVCGQYDECPVTREPLPFEEVDMVNHPKHYQSESGIEVIDVIEAFTKHLKGIDAVCTGNILKYVCRWPEKNGIEDLEKAEWYLRRLIKHLKGENFFNKSS